MCGSIMPKKVLRKFSSFFATLNLMYFLKSFQLSVHHGVVVVVGGDAVNGNF